ncbi:hypothetical protein T492DRAFT_874792 [Pavlovales sp. CCMP2436]|nr:hypothetical protein T492DRAFT_874792 [Pavlovales sp. CCMP2436]
MMLSDAAGLPMSPVDLLPSCERALHYRVISTGFLEMKQNVAKAVAALEDVVDTQESEINAKWETLYKVHASTIGPAQKVIEDLEAALDLEEDKYEKSGATTETSAEEWNVARIAVTRSTNDVQVATDALAFALSDIEKRAAEVTNCTGNAPSSDMPDDDVFHARRALIQRAQRFLEISCDLKRIEGNVTAAKAALAKAQAELETATESEVLAEVMRKKRLELVALDDDFQVQMDNYTKKQEEATDALVEAIAVISVCHAADLTTGTGNAPRVVRAHPVVRARPVLPRRPASTPPQLFKVRASQSLVRARQVLPSRSAPSPQVVRARPVLPSRPASTPPQRVQAPGPMGEQQLVEGISNAALNGASTERVTAASIMDPAALARLDKILSEPAPEPAAPEPAAPEPAAPEPARAAPVSRWYAIKTAVPLQKKRPLSPAPRHAEPWDDEDEVGFMAEDGAGPSSVAGPSFAAYNSSASPWAARGAGRGRGGRGWRAGGRGLAGGRGRGRAIGRGGGDGDGNADYYTLEGLRFKSMKLTPVMHELWVVLGREPPPPPLPPPPKPALAAPPAVVTGAQALGVSPSKGVSPSPKVLEGQPGKRALAGGMPGGVSVVGSKPPKCSRRGGCTHAPGAAEYCTLVGGASDIDSDGDASLPSAEPERDFPCDEAGCEYRAIHASNLTTHKQTHSGEQRAEPKRDFPCDELGCNDSATQADHLTTHRRAHSGERPYAWDGDKKAAHKQRFVWTAEQHRRFEVAVHLLGLETAKPLDILQRMNIDGHPPTHQHIKSHLQKYRLLLQKRSRSAAAAGGASGGEGARGV